MQFKVLSAMCLTLLHGLAIAGSVKSTAVVADGVSIGLIISAEASITSVTSAVPVLQALSFSSAATSTSPSAPTSTVAPQEVSNAGSTFPLAPSMTGRDTETINAGLDTWSHDENWVILHTATSAAASFTQTGSLARVTHYVEVGPFGKLFFQPSQVNAEVGDVVEFRFRSFNHTLTQSSLEEPCISSSRFDSGFRQFNPSDSPFKTLSFSVNDPDPQYFFCHQEIPTNHCRRAMVFAINPGENMQKFLENVETSQTKSAVPSQGFSSALWVNNTNGASVTPVVMRSMEPEPSTGEACRTNLDLIRQLTLAILILCMARSF